MDNNKKPMVVADDVVVTLEYELTVDGEVFDSSEEGDPVVFLQGSNQLAPGLESALIGLKIGESKEVTVSPEEGYGEYDPDAVVEVARSEFPGDFPLEPGTEITVHTDESDDEFDDIMEATIVKVDKFVVTLNFNHPLAGKTLHFKVKVLDLREATAEELEHGHVHGDHDHDDYEFDDDELDEFED